MGLLFDEVSQVHDVALLRRNAQQEVAQDEQYAVEPVVRPVVRERREQVVGVLSSLPRCVDDHVERTVPQAAVMRTDVPDVADVVKPIAQCTAVAATVGGADLEARGEDLLIALGHQVVKAAQDAERHHLRGDPDRQMWTVCLAEVHDEVSACALLVAVVLLEPFAVGSGRLGRRAGIFPSRRTERPGMPVGERVDPSEPVAAEEPEGRLDGAEGVAEAHADLVVELVQGDHVREAGPDHECVQADLPAFVVEPGRRRRGPVSVEVPVPRQPVVPVALQDLGRVGVVAAVHAPRAQPLDLLGDRQEWLGVGAVRVRHVRIVLVSPARGRKRTGPRLI